MRIASPHPALLAGSDARSFLRGLWRLADPKIALASLVPFLAGAALAFRETEHLQLALAAGAFLVLFLVEVGKNAVNDLFDFRSGADTEVLPEERSPFSGGKRVLVDRLLTEADLVVIAWASFAAAGALGVALVAMRDPRLLALGIGAALLAVLYSMPPFQLSYRGLGELAVFLVYGPGIVIGSTMLLGGQVTAEVVDVSIILGLLIAAVLLVNELPDERADGVARKRTLVVRMGRDLATSFVAILFGGAFALAVALVAYSGIAFFAGAFGGIPLSYTAWRLLRRDFDRPPVDGQIATLTTYVVTGLGLTIAAVLW
jgi:1,4-dihydroxy-2-naphthoate octaprenyltransferase